MAGGLTFAAALFLGANDRLARRSALRRVRGLLLNREPIPDEQFQAALSDFDHELVQVVRESVAMFFGVPEEMIHPGDNLYSDYRLSVLDPEFHIFVIRRAVHAKNIQPGWVRFDTSTLSSYPAFLRQINTIISSDD